VSVYFWGCWERSGHHLWKPTGESIARPHQEIGLPWASIDGTLCPGANGLGWALASAQEEGLVRVSRLGGWTALAWWDRSVDTRHGSNAGLFADADLEPGDLLAEGFRLFPQIFGRFGYHLRMETAEARALTMAQASACIASGFVFAGGSTSAVSVVDADPDPSMEPR
jgi:hypothetical protein